MTPEMKKVVGEFRALRRRNPDDAFARFQMYLVANGLKDRFSEKDVAAGAAAVGVEPHLIPEFLESLGSWV